MTLHLEQLPQQMQKRMSQTSPAAPSLQEVMMMRLKNAQREKERKALEEELIRDDAALGAAAAADAEANEPNEGALSDGGAVFKPWRPYRVRILGLRHPA
jgi:hypothetical protein